MLEDLPTLLDLLGMVEDLEGIATAAADIAEEDASDLREDTLAALFNVLESRAIRLKVAVEAMMRTQRPE